jgi:peptide/nickel transport system substrate-binding protein
MKRFVLLLLVASSSTGTILSAWSAQRPSYGQTLRIEMQAAVSSLEPPSQPGITEADGLMKLRALVYDRLVRLGANGQPQPALAVSWQHNPANTQWQFKLRAGVKWHDGAELTPADILSCLQDTSFAGQLQLQGDSLKADLSEPRPDLLLFLATDPNTIIRRKEAATATSLSPGTGPFRLIEWHPGIRAVFQANEDYWGGRPYLDNIDVILGRSSRDELIDLEQDKADVVQLDPSDARRAQQEGRKVWASSPIELLSLQFDASKPKVQDARLREAVVFAIDRIAIQKVILQNYGEATGSFLPHWLSGYTFLFSSAPDLERARKRLSEIGKPWPLKIGYDPPDQLARQVVERIAVNLRDVGMILEPVPLQRNGKTISNDDVDVRIARSRVEGPTFDEALAQAAAAGLTIPADGKRGPEDVYAAEQQTLADYMHVPLVYVPELFGIGPRLKVWPATQWGDWRLEDVWLQTGQ